MKLIKRIPFQIFVLILFAGLVGISGMLIMQRNLNLIASNYEQIIEDSLRDRLDMSELRGMMYRHHVIVSWHTLTDSSETKLSYENEAGQFKSDIMETLDRLNGRIKGSEKERLYHTVYSDAISYFSNADNVFRMSHEGNIATAKYYITSTMADFIVDINSNINILDIYISEEMANMSRKMEQSILFAEISETVCIICIVFVMAVCIIMCVRITARLENYKNQLEADNERKTKALIEHNERMLAIQESTVIGMANLIENRDHDTGEHVKRTSRYVELLTRAAQRADYCTDILTDDYAELLIKAAPMHDIGKIAVSDSILRKPGKLTDEEFDIMKGHTTAGGRIVAEVLGNIEEKEYIDIAVQVAEGHHEKWDGSGYPNGVNGENIPICARIMAVADVFDALVSKRCYKEPMSVDRAFKVIEESGGSHFDPELTRLFLSIRTEVEEVLKV